jgi:diguanylate cyclase (GGDEF)-like protein
VGTVLVAGAAGLFAANLHGDRWPVVLGWLPGPLGLLLAAGWLWYLARTAGLATAARQFWARIAGVSALCGIGVVVQAYLTMRSHGHPRVPTGAAAIFFVAMLGAIWALIRVPVGARTVGERIRLSLDGLTVVLGAGLFMWYVAFAPIVTDDGLSSAWASLSIGAVCLTALAAVVKIVLAGTGPIDPRALRMLALALLAGGVTAGASTLLGDTPVVPGQLSVPVIAWLVILAGERQRVAASSGAPAVTERPRGRVRPYSLLPYLAVAATDVLLVVATARPDDRRYPVVAGAITITALVVIRQVVAFVDNARLVEQLRQREDQLQHQASHDALTLLANRTLFGAEVDAALDELLPADDLAVLLVDLDDFKTVNDTLGHAVGDALLAAVAQRIRHCVRPGDSVARLGGDEFAVLLRRAHPEAVDAVAERILATLTRPVAVSGYQLLVQASIGVAVARPGDDTGRLLRNADIAMYAAKESGKAAVARYVPGMAAHILEHAQLGAQLRDALDGGQLHLLYQPIVGIADRRAVGVEALVRWRHPVRGLVPPAEFVPAAERTGLIVPLGRWVLREACRQQARWRGAHGDEAPQSVSVNVSGRQLLEPGFADEVADAVHENGLRPHDLVVEVTETAVLTGRQVLDTLHALRRFGVRIALDDFGTGQSSLGLIQSCPVDVLKLDKSFVDGITGGDRHTAVATAVAQIALAMGLPAVAEGIESQQQADELWRLGYRLGQGYHLVPPLSAEQLDTVLRPAGVSR